MYRLSQGELLQLKRWNTPTIYNGWEAFTRSDRLSCICNRDATVDFMRSMGPMVGYAVTVSIQPGNPAFHTENAALWSRYRRFVAGIEGPKIVVVQDLDSPDHIVGSFWGEVCANIHKSLGCVGTITDGAIRDVDEMTNAGFKAIARRLCIGHAYAVPLEWGEPVKVFGARIETGMLVHADKHGFIAVAEEEQPDLLRFSTFLDANECRTKISAARLSAGKSLEDLCFALDEADAQYTAELARFKETYGCSQAKHL